MGVLFELGDHSLGNEVAIGECLPRVNLGTLSIILASQLCMI